QVHISTWDATKKQWSGWTAISQRYDAGSSGWHYTGTNFTPLALTAYAGKRVRFDFYHSGQVNSGAGWYIDEVKVSREPIPTPISPNKPVTFEGLGFTTEDWQGIAADNGIWEVGIPGAPGPKSAHEGQNVVGTILQGGYPNWRGSGLITPSIIVPPIGSNDELHLRYWHWFRYGGADSNGRNPSYGQVHISTWDATKMKWSDWTAISPQYMGDSGGWTQPLLDITAYAGKTIRFNFYHSGQVNSGAGWYLDEITVLLPSPTITGFTPDHGPVDTLVTITGTYFTGATSVKFNGVDAKSFNVSDDGTTIYAVVKEGTTTGKITVVTPSDTVTSDNPFTVSSGAIVTGITLKPSVVYGGQSVSGTVTISDIAPSGGADVTLQPNSSLLDTLTVKVPAGSTIGTFSMIAKRTATSTKVTLTATLNGISKSADVTINPWTQTVTLSPTTVIGGVANSTGVVTLMAKAPAGGLTVTLKSSDIAVGTVLPTSITIPEGKKSGVFTITTYKVTSTKKLVITATTDTDATATLTVQAQVIGTLVLIPNSVTGGDDSIGIVTLTNAATQDTTVTLKSSNEAVATVVQSTGLKSVVIKAGEKSATFTIDTKTVTAAASVTINATLNGVKLSAALKVTP
ncbi:MAG: choice-of-anchor J domain-containing protein, partial [Armatimonadetes bacterium]|nr:choice-of-anchor J domain-containing protein [Armatimonadota bacterium]